MVELSKEKREEVNNKNIELDKFIANATDSINKQPNYLTCKKYHTGDELNLNPPTPTQWKAIYIIVTIASGFGFIMMFGS